MPSREAIVTFHDDTPPVGFTPWVDGAGPGALTEIVEPDPAWADAYAVLASRIRRALGWHALCVEHIGSTSVPGLPAKPIIDIDLTVADPDAEHDYVPLLQAAGFELRVREPWWFGHRLLRSSRPHCHLHVFGYDSPELVKHRIFRDWLRAHPQEVELYARVKRESQAAAKAAGEGSLEYNDRKQEVIRAIYARAFRATGLLPE